MKARVSVIVPIYNVEAYLPQCLDSILAQTMEELEIILVNNGSTDQGGCIAERYARQDSRIAVVHQKNRGVASGRNLGMEQASAPYVMFIDSDDWIDPELIEKLYHRAEETAADLVVCNYLEEYPDYSSAPVLERTDEIIDMAHSHRSAIYHDYMTSQQNSWHVWNKLYRLRLIQQQGLWFLDSNKVGGEDGLFNLCYLLHMNRAAAIDKPFYHYRQRPSSIMHSRRPEIISQYVNMIKAFACYVTEHHMEEELEGTLPFIAYHFFYMGLQHNINHPVPMKTILQQIRTANGEPVFRELMDKLIRIQVFRKKIPGSPEEESMFRRLRTAALACLCLAGMDRTLYYAARRWLWWKQRTEG